MGIQKLRDLIEVAKLRRKARESGRRISKRAAMAQVTARRDEISEIFARLTTLHNLHMPYDGEPHGELFIHWFYRGRRKDRLSRCEIFHLNMLQYFNVMDKVECIHVRCAFAGKETAAMREAVGILSGGKAKVDFQVVAPKKSWEHDTFKECAEYAAETGKFVYYTHFKGVTRLDDDFQLGGHRVVPNPLNILYWCYILYQCLFSGNYSGKVIGPIYVPGLNVSYRNSDLSWSRLKSPCHYSGTFQAFDGVFLKENFEELGMDREAREKRLWINDPYTAEAFLALVFPEDVITHCCTAKGGYHLWDDKTCPEALVSFVGLYDFPKELPQPGCSVYVSLTTWKGRVGNIVPVLRSLLAQTYKATALELELSVVDFPGRQIPDDLQALADAGDIHIFWHEENRRGFKKLWYCLQRHRGEDFIVLTVDDDWLYASRYIETMVKHMQGLDSYCGLDGLVVSGHRQAYRSGIFGPESWEALNTYLADGASHCDDAYITTYLRYVGAKLGAGGQRYIKDTTIPYNQVLSLEEECGGYTGEYIRKELRSSRECIEEYCRSHPKEPSAPLKPYKRASKHLK